MTLVHKPNWVLSTESQDLTLWPVSVWVSDAYINVKLDKLELSHDIRK